MMFAVAGIPEPDGVLGEDKSSQRENPRGPHQNPQLSTIRTSLSNGHKAPKDTAATLLPDPARRRNYQVHGP